VCVLACCLYVCISCLQCVSISTFTLLSYCLCICMKIILLRRCSVWIRTTPQISFYKSVYYWHGVLHRLAPSYIYCYGCSPTWSSASAAGILCSHLLLVETTLEDLHTSLKAVNQGAAIQPPTNRVKVSGEPSQHFSQLHGNISLPGNAMRWTAVSL